MTTPEALGLGRVLSGSGLNVAGVITPGRYNALVPESWRTDSLLPTAKSIYVVGSGGDAFYFAARKACPTSEHPLDEYCEILMTRLVADLEAAGAACRAFFYWQQLGMQDSGPGVFADFVALARVAGLGAPSRLGLLLHPTFGPWFAIRALVLSDVAIEGHAVGGAFFDPCVECDAPCIAACHGHAVSSGVFAGQRCADTRHVDTQCATRCDARLACPVGSEHRYGAESLAHHMRAHFRSAP